MSASSHKADAPGVYRRLLTYVKPHAGVLAVAVIGMVVYATTDSGFALLMQPLLRSLGQNGDGPSSLLPLMIVGLFVLRGVAGWVSSYGLGWIGRDVIKTLRAQVFSHLLHLPAGFYDRSSTGLLLSKITYNIEQVAASTSDVLTTLVRDALTIAGLLAVMVWVSPVLSAFIALVAPPLALVIRYLSRAFRRYSAHIQNSMGDVTSVSEEAITGHRVIKVFNGEDYECAQFHRANENNRRLNMKLVSAKSVGDSITQFLAAAAIAGIVYLATRESVTSAIDPAEFVSFLSAMLLLLAPLKRLTNVNVPLQRGIAAGLSIFQLLDEAPERDEGAITVKRARGDVVFRDVSFAYDQRKGVVLRHINLDVAAGQSVAVVGRSGSGKSTLVGLLPRFYDVESGSILLDGRDIREYSLASLRAQLALVSQDVVLFNDTIASNIAFGSGDAAGRDQIRAAAAAAHVLEFAATLPDGLDTVVGDRGVLLSGGQRQRIAIARAILKDAPILILDEATSALDSESERHIQAALEQLMRGRTSFVIAHRLSTVERADRILVLEAGRIVETGTHDELLRRGGRYAALYHMQFSAAAEA